MLCNLQIFSGCVCHLEQLHAQSPFLFPIVFSINLIPFFDICSADLLALFQPGCTGMCYFTWAVARSQQLLFVVLAAGLWCLTAGCHVKSPLFPQPPLKQKCAPRSRWEKEGSVLEFFTLSSQVQTNVTGEREIQPRERRNKKPVTTAALDRVCVLVCVRV